MQRFLKENPSVPYAALERNARLGGAVTLHLPIWHDGRRQPGTKGEDVAKKPPWYSKKELDVYHDDDACDKGNNIEAENIAYGTGNLPKCETCKRLG
jgi:hypothetical protein